MRSTESKKSLKEYVGQAKKAGIKVLPPDVNSSFYSFTLTEKNTIRFGLTEIKGLRGDLIPNIINVRKEDGRFTDVDQFLLRIDRKWLKEDYIMPLVLSGAFDSIDANRRKVQVELHGKIQNVLISGGSMDLLGIMTLKESKIADFSLMERLEYEEEYLGTYLSAHPTEQFAKLKTAKNGIDVSQVFPDMKVNLVLLVREIKIIKTKKMQSMAFIETSDVSGDISLTVFPKTYLNIASWLTEGMTIYVEGKAEASKYNGETQIIANVIEPAEKLQETLTDKKLFLRLTDEKAQYQQILPILKDNHGNVPVILFLAETDKKFALKQEFWVKESAAIKAELTAILGNGNVVFQD
jgi:DNA polymerase-3 subunit alpha